MPITRNTVLLAAGTYDLGSRTNAPTDLANHRSIAGLSLHHILPYRYPLCIGYLVDKYRSSFHANNQNWPVGASDDRSTSIIKVIKGMLQYRGQLALPHQFAWLGYNLFQGPSGNFRADDPKSNREPYKPISMQQKIWDQLAKIEAYLDKRVVWGSSVGGGYEAKFGKDFTMGDFDDMLEDLLVPLAKCGHSNALSFTLTDWIVMDSTSNGYALANIPSDNDKAKFKAFVRAPTQRPSHLQVYTPYDVQANGGTTLIWYLRGTNEQQPKNHTGMVRFA